MSSTPDWHPIHLFLISVCASWRMKMNAAERVYEFHCCSGHGTRSDLSKGTKRAPFLRDCLRRDARRRGRRLSHVLPARPQRCGTTVTQQSASLVYVHGGLMTCWMLLFALQCGLVTTGNRRLHIKLGMAAVVLYPVIVSFGLTKALLD